MAVLFAITNGAGDLVRRSTFGSAYTVVFAVAVYVLCFRAGWLATLLIPAPPRSDHPGMKPTAKNPQQTPAAIHHPAAEHPRNEGSDV